MLTSRIGVTLLLCLLLQPPFAAVAQGQKDRDCEPGDVSKQLALNQDSYTRDEPVRFKLMVKNISGESCTMGFPSSRGGTVRVFKDNVSVWEHGYCRAYTQNFEFATWEPGHREVYRYRWNQYFLVRDEQGRFDCDGERELAPPRSYEATGVFFGTEPDARTKRVEFRLSG